MTDSHPKLYEFHASCWANVPKLAISETHIKDVEFVNVTLAEGENFNPDFLKINPNGTVPALVSGGKTYTDSTTVVQELLKLAPHPPQHSAHSSTSIIEEIHAEAHDPNASMLVPVSEEDRQKKAQGVPAGFVNGRQKGLDKYLASAPEEFKDFIQQKAEGNKQLVELFAGNLDDKSKEKFFHTGQELWKSTGIVIRGVITQALQKTPGPFAGGEQPSEVDYHIITWLARVVSNAGVEPGSPSSEMLPVLQKWTGGHAFDPVIGKYWDAWIKRDSFKDNKIH